ncbi:MAG: HEAT repeat domain-containing protein [Anaerolineales bacterium]|nr:HEAT repeat domain-containing protein [Anaerolineales bacterium]
MINIIRNLYVRLFGNYYDVGEFFFGILLGILGALFYFKLEPIRNEISGWFEGRSQEKGSRRKRVSADQYRSDLIAKAQSMHVARAIFSLEEILVPPRLLAPPIAQGPDKDEAIPENTLSILPTLPDWNYLSGIYQAPTISFGNALSTKTNILITGWPGSGKTTALAYLAIHSALRDPEVGPAAELTPVFLHVAALVLDRSSEKDPLKPIVTAVQDSVSSTAAARLPGQLQSEFKRGRALLLLDGLDEFTDTEIPSISAWLERLVEKYPGNLIIAAGPAMYYDGLVKAGLVPVQLAPWTAHDQNVFMRKWAESWQTHIAPLLPKRRLADIDPALISGWLTNTFRGWSPLEITLQTWASYVGDMRGDRMIDCMEAYVERVLSPGEIKSTMTTALNWIKSQSGILSDRSIRRGTPINNMIEAGILTRHAGNRLSFSQPNVGAYLAAREIADNGSAPDSLEIGWSPAELTLRFLAAVGDISTVSERYLQIKDDPLELPLLALARCLPEAPKKAAWRADVMRRLAALVADANRPYGFRLRIVHALSAAKEETVAVLFQRLLESDKPGSRVLGALGLGGMRHEDSANLLIQTIKTKRNLHSRQAACLALASIGTDEALEGLGHILLESDEGVLIAAAEALACNPDEGYDMLRDAMEMENLLTRRAAVFGLARVPEAWAMEIIETVHLDDDQWVVRGAAAEALEQHRNPPWKILPPIEDLSALPWLQTFAEKEGLAVAPGRAALEMVRRALNKGSDDEQIAALEAIIWAGGEELAMELFQALKSPEPHLRDAAYEALWQLRASGIDIRSQTPS